MRRWRGAVIAAATVALVAPASTAWADGGGHGGHGGHDGHGGPDDQVTTVADHDLSGPRQMDQFRGNKLVVAESDSGEISSVNTRNGNVQTLFDLGAVNAQGVGYSDGQFFVALGETGGPDDPQPVTLPPPSTQCVPASQVPAASALVVTDSQGHPQFVCDLLAAEVALNPDGQSQVDESNIPFDSISNPFAVLVQDRRVLVADAGANTVWSVDRRNGRITPFFAPRTITTGACTGVPNNPATPSFPAAVGCDPTPTGVVEGPDGKIYVSGLSGLTQGEGRVYVLNQRGRLLRTIDHGLNPLTGIAVDRRGTIYVSELFGTLGAEGFFPDPTQTPGRVVRIDRQGNRTYVDVIEPQGLEFLDGSLYAAANSLIPDGGAVVRIGADAFGPTP